MRIIVAFLLTLSITYALNSGSTRVAVSEPAGVKRTNWPVSSGVGLPKWADVTNVDQLRVTRNADSSLVIAQFDVLACYGQVLAGNACANNGAFRVVKITLLDDFLPFQSRVYHVHWHSTLVSPPVPDALVVDSGSDKFVIDNDVFVADISKLRFNVLDRVAMNDGAVVIDGSGSDGGSFVIDRDGQKWSSGGRPAVSYTVEENGPLTALVHMKGYLWRAGDAFSNLTVYQRHRMLDDLLTVGYYNAPNFGADCAPTAENYPQCYVKFDDSNPVSYVTAVVDVRVRFFRGQSHVLVTHSFTNVGSPQGHFNDNGPAHKDEQGNWVLNMPIHLQELGIRFPFGSGFTEPFHVSTQHFDQGGVTGDVEKYVFHKVDDIEGRESRNFRYKTRIDGNEVEKGVRSTGLLAIKSAQGKGIVGEMMDFWQKTPSGIRMKSTERALEFVFMPDSPTGEPMGLFQWPPNNDAQDNPDNPNAERTRRYSGTGDIPLFEYHGLYNIGAGTRILDEFILNFDPSAKSAKAAILLSEAVRSTPLLFTHIDPGYLTDTFAFGEAIPVRNAGVNASTVSSAFYGTNINERDSTANDLKWTYKRVRQIQAAALLSPAFGFHKGQVQGGRDTHWRSNLSPYPGVDPGRHVEEGRFVTYSGKSYGHLSFFNDLAYGEIGWGNGYSMLHYTHDGSAGRVFLGTGEYGYFEWLRSGARHRADKGVMHCEIASRSGHEKNTIGANLYESSHGGFTAWSRQPPGYTSHSWSDSLKLLYFITGDRFALESLKLTAWNNMLQGYARQWGGSSGTCHRCSSRVVYNILNAYQATGIELFLTRSNMLMSELSSVGMEANGELKPEIPGEPKVLFYHYICEALRTYYLEQKALGNTAAELGGEVLERLARFYIDGILLGQNSGPRTNYLPIRSIITLRGSDPPVFEHTAISSGSDTLYLAYNYSGNAEFLRMARHVERDIIFSHCDQDEPFNLDAINSSFRGEQYCFTGGVVQSAAGSQSKELGWLLNSANFGTYQEFRLGGNAEEFRPLVRGVTGLPATVSASYLTNTIEVEVLDMDSDVFEVRLEWMQKDSLLENEEIRHILCYNDGSQFTFGHQMNIDRDNSNKPHKYIVIGPEYNQRTPQNYYATFRPSGDSSATDNLFTCTLESSDGVRATENGYIRVVVEDQYGNRAFGGVTRLPVAEFDDAEDEFDSHQRDFQPPAFISPTPSPTTIVGNAQSPSSDGNGDISSSTTSQGETEEETGDAGIAGLDMGLLISIIAGVVLLLLICVVVAFAILRRRRQSQKAVYSSRSRSKGSSRLGSRPESSVFGRNSYGRGSRSGSVRSSLSRISYGRSPLRSSRPKLGTESAYGPVPSSWSKLGANHAAPGPPRAPVTSERDYQLYHQ